MPSGERNDLVVHEVMAISEQRVHDRARISTKSMPVEHVTPSRRRNANIAPATVEHTIQYLTVEI